MTCTGNRVKAFGECLSALDIGAIVSWVVLLVAVLMLAGAVFYGARADWERTRR